MSILLPALLSCGEARAADRAAEIAAALASCDGARHPLPSLGAEQRQDLEEGKVVRILQHGDPEEPSTAIGLALLSGDRDSLWIAAQDPHTQVDEGLSEFIVRALGSDHALWYGYYDLPWPIKDRQWVVESQNTHTLARRSSNACWEHSWALVPGGLPEARAAVERGQFTKVTLEQIDSAIFTPVNHGSWIMSELPSGGTIVSYQATSVVGGAIPDSLVVQMTMARLESVLRALETRAKTWSLSHYRSGHAPVPGGGGEEITRFP